MEPLLRDGQTVRVLAGYYACHLPQRGEMVILRHAGHEAPLIKRVAAVSGDHFRLLAEGKVVRLEVNGQRVMNSAGIAYAFDTAKAAMLRLYERDYSGVIPDGAILVLGDRPEGTLDATAFGLVSQQDLLGKVEL